MDREKVIRDFETIINICREDGCDFVDLSFECAEYILALLKEQEQMYYTLEHDWRMCRKLLKEQEAIVRCKDCKKRNSWECWQYFFGRIKIPDDWFCADGEEKEGC